MVSENLTSDMQSFVDKAKTVSGCREQDIPSGEPNQIGILSFCKLNSTPLEQVLMRQVAAYGPWIHASHGNYGYYGL